MGGTQPRGNRKEICSNLPLSMALSAPRFDPKLNSVCARAHVTIAMGCPGPAAVSTWSLKEEFSVFHSNLNLQHKCSLSLYFCTEYKNESKPKHALSEVQLMLSLPNMHVYHPNSKPKLLNSYIRDLERMSQRGKKNRYNGSFMYFSMLERCSETKTK